MPTYKTPGVYTEEISTLPPSIAEVATAIPAFIGYTEKAKDGDEDLSFKPIRINSLLEYRSLFGGPSPTNFNVHLAADDEDNQQIGSIENADNLKPRFLMYYSLSIYFKNGGGPCYVVSVGNYDATLSKTDILAGLDSVRKEDEPTLLLLTDAVNLEEVDYYEVCQSSLKQCSDLKDRFAIFDVLNHDNDGRGKIGANFRDGIVGDLKYGAAYYPYLQTSINHHYTDTSVAIHGFVDTLGEIQIQGLRVTYRGPRPLNIPQVTIVIAEIANTTFAVDQESNTLTITAPQGISADIVVSSWKGWAGPKGYFNLETSDLVMFGSDGPQPVTLEKSGLRVTYRGKSEPSAQAEIKLTGRVIKFDVNKETMTLTISVPEDGEPVEKILKTWKSWSGAKDKFNLERGTETYQLTAGTDAATPLKYDEGGADVFYLGHSAIEHDATILYNQIKLELGKQRVLLPPSAAMAGIFARIDRTKGVWSAPANEAVSAVITPSVKITHGDQENLNIDTNAGKSINAIRSFVGKGTLVWGSRTLAGNDNEWRYIPVRRLFNMIEESIQKSTAWAVFGPNNAMAWMKVKAMVESYLEGLWRQGALVGSTPDQAYFVHVGLGSTMTQQDILEGRMVIEIGIAAVRPAEFIIFKFSHKMQEA